MDNGADLIDLNEILTDIVVPKIEVGSVSVSESKPSQKDIFAEEKRKAWNKSVEARCDFTYRLRLTRRSNVNFVSIWQKSLYGRTLTEIKADDDMGERDEDYMGERNHYSRYGQDYGNRYGNRWADDDDNMGMRMRRRSNGRYY